MPVSPSDARRIKNSLDRVELSLATPMSAAMNGWQNEDNSPAVRERFLDQLKKLMEAERQISEMRFRQINAAAASSEAISELTKASKEVRDDAEELKRLAKRIDEVVVSVDKITDAVKAAARLLP